MIKRGFKYRIPIPYQIKDYGEGLWYICLADRYVEVLISNTDKDELHTSFDYPESQSPLQQAKRWAAELGISDPESQFRINIKAHGVYRVDNDFLNWLVFVGLSQFAHRSNNRDRHIALLKQLNIENPSLIHSAILGGLTVSTKHNTFRINMSSTFFLASSDQAFEAKSKDLRYGQFLLLHSLLLHKTEMIKSSLIHIEDNKNLAALFNNCKTNDFLGLLNCTENKSIFIFSTKTARDNYIKKNPSFQINGINFEGIQRD